MIGVEGMFHVAALPSVARSWQDPVTTLATNAHRTLRPVFTYDRPWVTNGRGDGQIYWQKRPGTLNYAITVKWNDGYGHSYSASGDLAQDRVSHFGWTDIRLGAGQSGQAKPASLSLG